MTITGVESIARKANRCPDEKFNALMHHFSVENLHECFKSLDGRKALGIDGMSNAAGAIVDSFSYKRAIEKNIEPSKFLENNDSYHFFKKTDDLLMTGSTGTNVMDIQIIIKIA